MLLSGVEQALVQAIKRQEPQWIALLGQLVGCDSGTFNKPEVDRAGRLLADAVAGLGFTVERMPQEKLGDHVVARKAGRRGKRLLFLGHFDTVFPPGTVEARPFTIVGDRATGPGVYDMKSGLTALVAALHALREVDAPVWEDVTFTVVFNSDEEILSPTSRPIIEAEARQAHTVCVLEPARPGGEYTFVRKGAGFFKLAVTGRAAHSGSQHELGRSAIEELAQKVLLLHGVTDYASGTTVNVGLVRGGERPNIVAPQAECEFDLRVLTLEGAERAQERFREIAALQFVADTQTELSGRMLFPPLPRQRRNEVLFSWVQEAGRKLGLELGSVVSGGASDGNSAGQLAPLIDGMGAVGDGAHSDREFVLLPTLVERAQVLALFLLAWPERADQLAALGE